MKLTSLSLTVLVLISAPAIPQVDGETETVRILRDPYGVPHVLAESDYGAFYGHAWALAEDHLSQALSALWTTQGRRTEIDGEAALHLDRSTRLTRITAEMEEDWDNFPESIRSAGEGFADGLNDYMLQYPELVPEWAEPIHPAWPMGLGRLIQFLPQMGHANGKMPFRKAKFSFVASDPGSAHYKMIGSNSWAISPERMAEGKGVMLTDPHLPWKNEFRLYEVHMRGKTFEVAGAAFIGVPLPVFGRNRSVSWAWTWNGPDHADVYRLKLDPKNPEHYLFDGKSVPFKKETHSFRMPDGSSVQQDLYWSVHGPVTYRNKRRGYALAARLSVFGQRGGPEQMYRMIQSRSVKELDEAMASMQIPHFNLVTTDLEGSVQYTWCGRVPRRPEGFDFSAPVDGSISDTLWDQEDVVPWHEMPRVVDPPIGYVQSCNNHPNFTTATTADPQPDSWPSGTVENGELDTMRAWYLRQRLAEHETHTEEQALDLATDNYLIPHLAFVPQLKKAWDTYSHLFPARDTIAANVNQVLSWDGIPSINSPVPTIFTVWLWEAFDHKVFLPSELLEKTPDDVDLEYAFKLLDGMVRAQGMMNEMSPLPNVPWGLIHIIRKNGQPFPVASGMYPAISLWNANVDVSAGFTKLTARVGSAYTAFSVMDDPMRTYTITPLGQTDDPEKPYCYKATSLYAKGQLKPLPFTDAQLQNTDTTEFLLKITRQ